MIFAAHPSFCSCWNVNENETDDCDMKEKRKGERGGDRGKRGKSRDMWKSKGKEWDEGNCENEKHVCLNIRTAKKIHICLSGMQGVRLTFRIIDFDF